MDINVNDNLRLKRFVSKGVNDLISLERSSSTADASGEVDLVKLISSLGFNSLTCDTGELAAGAETVRSFVASGAAAVFVNNNAAAWSDPSAEVKSILPERLVSCIASAFTDVQTANDGTEVSTGSWLLRCLTFSVIIERLLGCILGHGASLVMKEILSEPRLLDILGADLVLTLRIIVGPPDGINVRNLVWHGFLATELFHYELEHYSWLLAYVLVRILQTVLQRGEPVVELAGVDQAQFSAKLDNMRMPVLCDNPPQLPLQLQKSTFILPGTVSIWQQFLLQQPPNPESMSVLMALMEHALRLIYVQCNGLGDACGLTAEHDERYIIMDTMLGKYIPPELIPTEDPSDSSDSSCELSVFNKLPVVIGRDLTALLMDLFEHPMGPRIRDRISHGESLLLPARGAEAKQVEGLCTAVHYAAWKLIELFADTQSDSIRCDSACLVDHGHTDSRNSSSGSSSSYIIRFHGVSVLQNDLLPNALQSIDGYRHKLSGIISQVSDTTVEQGVESLKELLEHFSANIVVPDRPIRLLSPPGRYARQQAAYGILVYESIQSALESLSPHVDRIVSISKMSPEELRALNMSTRQRRTHARLVSSISLLLAALETAVGILRLIGALLDSQPNDYGGEVAKSRVNATMKDPADRMVSPEQNKGWLRLITLCNRINSFATRNEWNDVTKEVQDAISALRKRWPSDVFIVV